MNNGGPAFPINYQFERNDGSTEIQRWEGISLRDYFAAKAMQGLLASPFYSKKFIEGNGWRDVSECAYKTADAMIAERSK